ncbi:MAG: DNA-binding protein [SAR324 cluster bacterium]|nr:DNA-binding protein [SAR324 cluster bacterium]
MNPSTVALQFRSISKLVPIAAMALLLSFTSACDPKTEKLASNSGSSGDKMPQTSLQRTVASQSASSKLNQMVVNSISPAGRYIYIEGSLNGEQTWVATNQMDLKRGDTVSFSDGQLMTNFFSKTLNRTFDKIIFTDSVRVVKEAKSTQTIASGKQTSPDIPQSSSDYSAGPKPDNPHKNEKIPTQQELSNISVPKVEGGYTVEELYMKKKELNQQPVKVRGKVVKYMAGIMGKNWIHLQDGTGSQGTHDITITTLEQAQVGETIVGTGNLIMDKDFGQGYRYSLIIEDASIVKE